MSQVGKCHGLSLRMTKRDVASAFRLLRAHPSLALVMVTEFPADHVGLETDLACFYFVMPFGWRGSPAHFARFGDAVAKEHRICGLSLPNTQLQHSFRSMLYADGGIFVGVKIGERLRATTQCWGRLTLGIPGTEALNEDKLKEEGSWEKQQILLGFASTWIDSPSPFQRKNRWTKLVVWVALRHGRIPVYYDA